MPDFPSELAALRQWVCWRLEPDKRSGKDAKIPYNPASGRRASSSNPESWGTLEEALLSKEKYLFSGIGFVFTVECGIIGIDIDHCLDNGTPNEVAADILGRLPPTYVEVSPSGTGLHIFLKGTLPPGGNRNSKTGVEMYSGSRYFTMTGQKYKGSADAVGADNGVIEYIHQKYIAPPKKTKKQPSNQIAVYYGHAKSRVIKGFWNDHCRIPFRNRTHKISPYWVGFQLFEQN